MECNFYVGQKVVCVNAAPGAFNKPQGVYFPDTKSLVEGNVYTIRAVYVAPGGLHAGEVLVRLHEIVRPIDGSGVEGGYNPSRFRPLCDTKTDISLLREIVRKVFDKELQEIDA